MVLILLQMLEKRKRSDSPARTESVASSVKRDDTRSVSSGDLDLVRVFAGGVRPATDQVSFGCFASHL